MDAAIRKAKDSIGNMFDKNLHDLVRGIRNHKENEAKYIAECIDEIKLELKQDNMTVKANAINKLCYLEMLGYDISWAAFNIIEVMSSTKFTYKRIGYLAASQSFHEGTDVLMLTTNMIRKDLGSQNMYEAGIALSGLSCFLSADLARDLASEIMTLMTSSKPYIRKKAVLIMYKIFLKYPDALRPAFPRLKEKLDDPEPSVQAAAVNVICELARKNPKNYLSLAPIFFKLMTISSNNWVLIKIIKLFGALTPLEPRLGKKLIEPLTNLINSTSAMSLLYECINTVLAVLVSIASGQPNHNSAIEICLQKLRILIEDSDQNLKYLGLLAMSKILQTNPKSVQTHKDLIMQCLDDKDESIRLRSLDLLYGMVSKKNLMEIIKKLMLHMNKAEGTHYRDELLAKIVDICSQNNYQHVTNFEWYVSVLVELTRMEGTRHGKLLSSQMLDVAIRVESIRPFIVTQMAILIDNIHVFTSNNTASSIANNNSGASTRSNNSDVCEVLYAATWICGEFAEHLYNPKTTLESMLKAKINNLPGHIQSTFVQNIFKLYTRLIHQIYEKSKESNEVENDDDDYVNLSQSELNEFKELTEFVNEKLQIFEQNADIEVQERACTLLQLLKYIAKIIEKHEIKTDNVLEEGYARHKIPRIDVELAALFEGDLNPVAAKAQRKVPIPDGLNLAEWINDEPSDLEDNNEDKAESNENQISFKNEFNKNQQLNFTSLSSSSLGNNYGGSGTSYNNASNVSVGAKKIQSELSQEDIAKYRETRKLQIESNPYYIKSSSSGVKKSESNALISNQMSKHVGSSASDSIRSQSIDLKIPLSIPGVTSSDKYYRMTQIDYENKKLKKKMKNKIDKKKKKNKQEEDSNNINNNDEDDDDLDEPVIKVLSNEMPEGCYDSGDESKKLDLNDPHRALDINLDEPLKESEKSPVVNRKTDVLKSELKSSETKEKTKEKPKKKSKDKSSKSDKEKNKKKKSLEAAKSDLLTLIDDNNDNDDAKEKDYNELLSPEQDNLSLANSFTQSPSNSRLAKTNVTTKTMTINRNDDLDYWLSNESAVVVSQTLAKDETKNIEQLKSSKKSKKPKHNKNDDESSNNKKEKKKKDKKVDSKHSENPTKITNEDLNSNKINGNVFKTKSFKLLAFNKHLKIKYQVEPNSMNLNQLIVKLRLKNLTTNNSQINSIELIILDTVNLKLIRNDSSNEVIKIEFSLDSNCENDLEYLFNASDCTFQQNLKGTLTYMLKSEQGAIDHEKIDFKLNVPCSKYLVKNKSDCDDFNKWLTSGQLNSKASIKIDSLNFEDVNSILNFLSCNFVFTIVETIDNNASLFTSTIQNHPICLLVKYSTGKNLSIEAKSMNQSLIDNLLEEFKSFLKV